VRFDIVNGLVVGGFSIRGLWETPRPDSGPPPEELEPGSDAHQARYIPYGLRVVVERG
jgi:hypothetical protein